MKKTILQLVTSVFIIIFFSGCLKDQITRSYSFYAPIYKSKAEVLANIKSDAPQSVSEVGKFYLYGNYIFLNEVDKGVHIIDNANPSDPKIVRFISIPGNLDIAVKGNILYADMYSDLLAIDISDPLHAKLTKVVDKVFPDRFYMHPSSVIVGWEKRDTIVKWNEKFQIIPNCRNCMEFDAFSLARTNTTATAPSPSGVGGSMARFTIVNNYLYTVNSSTLEAHDITIPADPVSKSKNYIGWAIETIYPFKEKLFIGSRSGMFIYEISNAATPQKLSQFIHARACDPVVADHNYAFVTLRSGSACEGFTNQLDVINIKNILSPTLVKTYPFTHPHGLAKDGDLLFICDGKDGLKVYNTADPLALQLLNHVKGLETFDAIAWNNLLLVVAKDGLHQFSYDLTGKLIALSKINISK